MDKIRELADQAIAYANETWNPDSEPERFLLIAMRKHAELIVKECADISDASFHNGSAGYTAILKHFGVEK